MPDITADDIAQAALDPQSASADNQSATAHSIPDQIKAAQFQAGADALAGGNDQGGPRSGWASLRQARAVPPGAV